MTEVPAFKLGNDRSSVSGKIVARLKDQRLLFEAFWVAVSLHILLMPVLWITGWMLPWPKSAHMVTILEYDLSGWPHINKPKKIYEWHNPNENP